MIKKKCQSLPHSNESAMAVLKRGFVVTHVLYLIYIED